MSGSSNARDASHRSERGMRGSHVVAAAAIALAFCVTFFLHEHSIATATVDCHDPDGPRPKIDIRQFETQYRGYSISLQGEIAGKGKLAATIAPNVLETPSESIQMAMEFHKTMVASHNSCAVSRQSYNDSVRPYQPLDGIAHQIQTLENKSAMGKGGEQTITQLVYDYSTIARNLGNPGK